MDNFSIADLHCDLLCYLENNSQRTPFDPEVRCSIPQLKEGGVKLQVMAAFAETGPGSSVKGLKQVEIFKSLPEKYPEHFHFVDGSSKSSIGIMLAIESASTLWGEEEILELERLEKPLYISLTWNGENRFGGGAHTSVGLKADGKRLLDYLDGKRIALDLSHASDALAKESLSYIDSKGLNISIIASHSNFRAVTNVSRNLPDELAKEIFRRKGLIGLNFVRDFVGPDDSKNFIRHLEHGLKLGGEKHLCLGADFYFGGDIPEAFRKPAEKMFFPEFANASSYPALIALWRELPGIHHQEIAYQNLKEFLKKQIF